MKKAELRPKIGKTYNMYWYGERYPGDHNINCCRNKITPNNLI